MGSFPNMMNFLNFRNLTKRKVHENRYFPLHKILEATWKQLPSISEDSWNLKHEVQDVLSWLVHWIWSALCNWDVVDHYSSLKLPHIQGIFSFLKLEFFSYALHFPFPQSFWEQRGLVAWLLYILTVEKLCVEHAATIDGRVSLLALLM
jgi:hypothetical protein